MRTRLSHLNALRAFEATARLGSFARAAEELAVTPAAVGQQVRALEDYLGSPLFERRCNRLVLTAPARAVVADVTEAFDRLAHAASRLRSRPRGPVVTITVAPSFAAKWLMPRLHSFHSAHPGIDVRLDMTERLVDLARDEIALGVRYGSGRYPALDSTLLMTETVFPVCSPTLLGTRRLLEVSDLAGMTLIHDTAAESRPHGPSWSTWLKAFGTTVDAQRSVHVRSGLLALQVAIDGHGVALARSVLAATDLRQARLVRPLPGMLASRQAYYVVHPAARPLGEPAATFCHWLENEARQFVEEHGEPGDDTARFANAAQDGPADHWSV